MNWSRGTFRIASSTRGSATPRARIWSATMRLLASIAVKRSGNCASAHDADVRRGTRRIAAPAELHYLEVVGDQTVKGGVENAVVPARIGGPTHVHVGPVVGDDQAVTLHRAEDALDLGS